MRKKVEEGTSLPVIKEADRGGECWRGNGLNSGENPKRGFGVLSGSSAESPNGGDGGSPFERMLRNPASSPLFSSGERGYCQEGGSELGRMNAKGYLTV